MMTRDTYKTVTVPILIDCPRSEKADGNASFLPGLKGLRPVQVIRDGDLRSGSKFWESLTQKEKEELAATLQLIVATEKEDDLAVRTAFASLEKGESGLLEQLALKHPATFRTYSEARLDEKISEQLERAQLVVWSFQGKPTLAIYCADVVTAYFVKLLLSRVTGKGLAVCPHCGNCFLRTRSNNEYCSMQHREAHRVARWREKKAAESKTTKGRKRGK